MNNYLKLNILLFVFIIMMYSNLYAGLTVEPFEKIYECPGHSSQQIYDAAKIFLAKNVKDIKFSIEDKQSGYFISSGYIKNPSSNMQELNWKLFFTVRLDVKEGKFKMQFTNVMVIIPGRVDKTTIPGKTFIFSKDSEISDYSDSRIKEIQESLYKLGNDIIAYLKSTEW